jgi:hypothetical protein
MVYQPLDWPNLYLVKVMGEGFTMTMMLAAMEPPRIWLPGFQVAHCRLLRIFHI